MSNQSRTGQVSSALLLLVGLLAGFIGGYAISHRGTPPAASALDAVAAAGNCPYELAPADRDILEGFKCPAVTCSDLLLDCHCEVAHKIKQTVKQLLAEGKSPEEVRSEVRAQYNLKT